MAVEDYFDLGDMWERDEFQDGFNYEPLDLWDGWDVRDRGPRFGYEPGDIVEKKPKSGRFYVKKEKEGMRITSVTVRKNKSSRSTSYEHTHVECTVDVKPGESPDEAVDYAKFFVDKSLGNIDEKQLKANAKYIKFLERE